MKALYIAAVDRYNPKGFGVIKKIDGQVKAFNKLGIYMRLINLENSYLMINNEKQEKITKPQYMMFHYYLLKNFNKIVSDEEMVYIRHFAYDIFLYYLIRKFKKNNIFVVLEIPTYPLDQYIKNPIKRVIYEMINGYVIRNLSKYTDYISVTNDYDEIYNIETIKINNALDLESLPLKSQHKNQSDEIHLIGIANLSPWHGYDRVIRGISKYDNREKKVHFHIVGEGDEKQNLVNLSNELGVIEYIHFEGAKSGEDLDSFFNNMDVGISSLALFRAGGGHDPIKTKEFIGRGLPTIVGYKDRLVDMSESFIFEIPEDDSDVDIFELVKWYNSLTVSEMDIRKYAEANLTWESQMDKVRQKLFKRK